MVLAPSEIKGKLYERRGVKYLEVSSVKPAGLPQPEEADIDEDHEEQEKQDWEAAPVTPDPDDSEDRE